MRIQLRLYVSTICRRSFAPWRLVRSRFGVVIQQKKQRPSGFWKLVGHDNDSTQYVIPTTSLDPVKETQSTTTAFHSSQVPTVRTSLPSEDLNEEKHALARCSEKLDSNVEAAATVEKRQRPSENTQPKKSRQNTPDIFPFLLKARKFHLVRSPSPISSPFLAPKTIAQKHRNKRKKDLAIFAEGPEIIHKAKVAGDYSRNSSGETGHVHNGEKKDTLQLKQPRKRPNATAAERKWRTETWADAPKPNEVNGSPKKTAENINEPSSQWNYESTRLTEQLQEVTLEEIHASEQRVKGLSSNGQVKIKPKPPQPRQSRTDELAVDGSRHDLMTCAINSNDGGEYVLDTYVRSSAQPFEITEQADPQNGSLHVIDHGKIGILIIEDEEEEALWETFAEDRQSDPEWNSEEEDENGL